MASQEEGMKQRFAPAIVVTLALVAFALAPTPATAQTTERVFDQGTVWSVSYIRTKPNMFNSYLKNLSQVWRAFLEEQKNRGDVVSYRILNVQNPRDGEPDLILLTEFKNMAVFDQSLDEFDELAETVMGSLESMQTDNIAREDMRTLRGSLLARELHFKQ
jgi:hypothetical protein